MSHPSLARRLCLAPLLLLLIAVTGCRSGGKTGSDKTIAINQPQTSGGPGRLTLTSGAFRPGRPIPEKYSANGDNVSPPLQWSGTPSGTEEFVLIVEDPDAPTPQPFVHWVAFRIPPGASSLPEDSGSNALVGQGANSANGTGYFGPRPPPGKPHRYYFQLFALNEPLGVDEGATREQVLAGMKGKVLGRGSVVGTFRAAK